MIIDWSLIITLGVIFFITLVGAWLRSRRTDECLKSFDGYHVTLEEVDNKVVWGTLQVEPTGIELLYRRAIQDQNHIESSYVMYSSEYGDIQGIYRYADDLSKENQKRREKDLQRWFHPGPLRYLYRKFRHFLATASESLNEVIGVLIGSARKPAGRYITDTSEDYLKKLGGEIIGYAGSAQDPILERFIGKRIVFELAEEDEVHEHVGIFKNYSDKFLEVLDVQFPVRQRLELAPNCTASAHRISAVASNGEITVTNHCDYPILLQSLRIDDEEEDEELLNVVVDGGEQVQIHPGHEFEKAELQIKVVREMDMLVSRSRAAVRHRAENLEKSALPDIIFDLGVVLRGRDRYNAREQRLRDQLKQNPNHALAAANLGAILIQQGKFGEAEHWLNHALARKNSLPDGGRRAEMQLRELERRRARLRQPLPERAFESPAENVSPPGMAVSQPGGNGHPPELP